MPEPISASTPLTSDRRRRQRLIRLSILLVPAILVYLPLRISRANDRLKQAIFSSDADGVRAALDEGAEPDLVLTPSITGREPVGSLLDTIRKILHRSLRSSPHTSKTVLMYAANVDRPEIVHLLLQHGADVNLRLDNGYTALLFAASKHSPDMLAALLAKGADLHAHTTDNATALMFAAQAGQTQNVRLLLGRGADVHAQDQHARTALSLATENRRHETIELLLEQGADERDLQGVPSSPANSFVRLTASGPGNAAVTFNGRTMFVASGQPLRLPMSAPSGMPPLLLAAKYGSPPLLKFLWARAAAPTREREGWSALCGMVQSNKVEGVRFLLDQHVPVNAPPLSLSPSLHYRSDYDPRKVYTPLHYAAALPSPAIAQLLIARGADVNAEDMGGTTPLLAAAGGAHLATVQLLIAHGANVQAIEHRSGQNALMRGISNPEMVKLLLEQGLDVNARDHSGRTALMQCYDPKVAAFLIAHGANVNAVDNQGNTPLLNAVQSFRKEQVILLLQHGANVHCVNAQGETPLSRARTMRIESMVTLLTDAGAKN